MGVIILKKINANIIMIILGCLFIILSLVLGYSNQFSEGQGAIFLLIGVPLLVVDIAFTPKAPMLLWNIIDMIVMFFSKP